jgi:hypothetical protein
MGTGAAAAFPAVIPPHHRFQLYHRANQLPLQRAPFSIRRRADCCLRFRFYETLRCAEFTLIYWQG